MNTKLKFVRNVLYKLKRSYGMPVDLHKIESHSVDPPTGEKTTILGVIHVSKAIVLRAREFRSFVYDLAFISANKDFTTGGFFDPTDRRVIFAASDLGGYEPTISDFLIIDNERYDVKEVHELEQDYGYGVLARKLKGQNIRRIVPSHSGLILSQAVESVTSGLLERVPTSVLNLTHELQEVP
jgi:hypothetical protein